MSAFLQLTLAIIVLAAKAGGYIAVHRPFVNDPELLHEEISDLASLAGVILVFVAELEVTSELPHASRASFLSGVLSVIAPLLMGASVALGMEKMNRWIFSVLA